MNPFLATASEEIVTKRLEFSDIPESEIEEPLTRHGEEMTAVHKDIEKKVRDTSVQRRQAAEASFWLVVLHHIDHQVHHGIRMISNYGGSLTGDSVFPSGTC